MWNPSAGGCECNDACKTFRYLTLFMQNNV